MKSSDIAWLLFIAIIIAPALINCIDNVVQGRQNVNYSMSVQK